MFKLLNVYVHIALFCIFLPDEHQYTDAGFERTFGTRKKEKKMAVQDYRMLGINAAAAIRGVRCHRGRLMQKGR